MDRNRFGGAAIASDSANGSTATRSAPSPLQTNYNCRKVQAALKHLASIDLIELCNEAKVEHCRATRDLRSCGRNVQSVLNSCGHASLCEECSQRCDICPICRTPMLKNGNRLQLRLYYECIEAGLISKRRDDRFQEKEDGEKQLAADVQRLYSLFDVATENNLVSLICHYVTDVCMDESVVSSDPVVAFLLDEVVVKDWCKWTFKNIVAELQGIYNLTIQEMKERLGSLLKFSVKLAGISNVLEVLESSLKGSLSVRLHDLHHLLDSILKTKQHMEMMIWGISHQFLQNVRSRHNSFTSWRSLVRERKSAAIKRAWPDSVNHPAESTRQNGSTLFIEDALSNLDIEHEYAHENGDELQIASFQKDGGSLYFRSNIEGMAGSYPFENPREAIDVLFLRGSSDLVVAKQAIFLYYLFDRHWTMPDDNWRNIVDDFAATFSITRHSLLESFTFYLLDDHNDDALQEACGVLPEISGPTTHPKVAQVILERQNPDAALMVLRWSGKDGGTQLVLLDEAITAVRVRVECGLLTEAFMYQRSLCKKVKEKKFRHELPKNASDGLKDEHQSWVNWVEALVTEICCLCVRRDLVDRMIELPWNSDEEKHLHKCLLDFSMDDPSTNIGSLLVVFYLQRYRYIEAYQLDGKLQNVEQDFILKNSISEEFIFKMRSASHWRRELVDKSIELLPEVQQQQVKTGKLPEVFSPVNELDGPVKSDLTKVQEPILTSLLAPSAVDSSLVLRADNAIPSLKPSVLETPARLGGSVNNSCFEFENYGTPSIHCTSFFHNAEKGQKPQSGIRQNIKFDDIRTQVLRHASPNSATPLKELNRSASRVPQNSHLQDNQFSRVSPEREQNGFTGEFRSTIPYSRSAAANTVTSFDSSRGIFKDFTPGSYANVSGKRVPSDTADRPRNVAPSDDSMDISWRHDKKGFSVEDKNVNGGPRWRSDDTSEDEEQQSLDRLAGVDSYDTPMRGIRRSRFSRR